MQIQEVEFEAIFDKVMNSVGYTPSSETNKILMEMGEKAIDCYDNGLVENDYGKIITIFAGPNGSGKSTCIAKYIELGLLPKLYIGPDTIVKRSPFCEIEDEREKYIAGMEYAKEMRKTFLENGIPFIMETVFSTEDKLNFVKDAKRKGFKVKVVFITTNDPQINISRVEKRVHTGGHYVPKEKIIKRYEKTMTLLNQIIKTADVVRVYDNSDVKPNLICEKKQDGSIMVSNEVNWVKKWISI